MQRSRHRAPIKIEHRNIGRAGISDEGAASVRRDIDEKWTSVDADGGHNFILLGVNHADIRRSRVDHVNFVALRIGCDSSGIRADLQGSHRLKTSQINDSNRIALAICYIRVLAVKRAVGGEGALVKVIPSRGKTSGTRTASSRNFSSIRGRLDLATARDY